ncbi:MAG: transporter substrate-binding domain-containing protein [Synergistaceae bacterium]|nr:transporter substrate-binding domain-containing protein [Synergistaceae bacterium]
MKNSRRFIACTLALCGALAFAPAVSAADQLEEIRERGTLVVAMEGTWAPWTYHDEADKLVGYDVEVAEKIAEKLGVKASFVEGEWDGLFAGLDAKRYDIVVNGVEFTAERAEKYSFSVPYGYIHTALVVRADNDTIKSFEDLKGKTTANSIASTYMILAESYGAEAKGVDTLDETMMMVLSGRADATLNANVSFYDYKRVHPEAPLKEVALTKDASHVCIPMRKDGNSASLKEAIDAAIEELRASGELKTLSEKYFGSDISGTRPGE